jgi:hypothetical protein
VLTSATEGVGALVNHELSFGSLALLHGGVTREIVAPVVVDGIGRDMDCRVAWAAMWPIWTLFLTGVSVFALSF